MSDPNLMSAVFDIDGSLDHIENQHLKFARYLKERFLTIDIFDADSKFLFGSCKLPIFELMRQGRSCSVKAKECEMCDPESGEFRGCLQIIMSNTGKIESITQKLPDRDDIHGSSNKNIGRGGIQPN